MPLSGPMTKRSAVHHTICVTFWSSRSLLYVVCVCVW